MNKLNKIPNSIKMIWVIPCLGLSTPLSAVTSYTITASQTLGTTVSSSSSEVTFTTRSE